ncbi:TrfA protein [Pandoraea captiosa]|uniref:TrfA protein n=1 Tax=Pandoraea captiosa TaxID=2508302 RepID=A0A5E5AW73_9BURK|nr:plasmid replication initiator TrfA [Pandoraea captiosa]VVE76985.1 TrfA protein [Pandoraea captiosa]
MTALTDRESTAWPKLPLKYGLNRNFVAPNSLAQSAVFSTQYYRSNADRPEYSAPEKLRALNKIEVFQTAGHRLDQGDADVFYELLRRVLENGREMDRETHVRFNRGELLKALGRTRGGTTRTSLEASLDRLYRAEFKFSVPSLFEGRSRLILKMIRSSPDSPMEYEYDVLLDVELARLFDGGQWTLLRRAQRDKLKNMALARGLHALYSTLLTPHPMLPKTIQELMGRDSMQDSKWRKVLAEALKELKKATGWARCELAVHEDTKQLMVFVERDANAKPKSKAGKQKAVNSPSNAENLNSPSPDESCVEEEYDDI